MLNQSLQQNHSLVMTQAMQQAFAVLQMQTLELEAWLEEETTHNPLLSYESSLKAAGDERVDTIARY